MHTMKSVVEDNAAGDPVRELTASEIESVSGAGVLIGVLIGSGLGALGGPGGAIGGGNLGGYIGSELCG